MDTHHAISMRRTLGVLFLACAVGLTSCSIGAPTSHQTLSSDPVVRWIQQHASPLRTIDPGGSDTDLAPLRQIVGNASIVGLGEETHGTHELIEGRARLAEYLITHLGFTTFVMENDWGASQQIDAYINGGSGDLTTIMQANLFGSWRTQEYEALFTWMRAYNANPAHTAKLHFLGMDMQDVYQSDFTTVEQYVQQVAPQQVSQVQSLYAPIMANFLSNPFTYTSLDAMTKQQNLNQAQHVYDLLQAHQQVYTQASSPQQYAFALQTARIIVQCTTFWNTPAGTSPYQLANRSTFFKRDPFLAENVEWIHDYAAGADPKIIVWAHDVHIANNTTGPYQGGKNMGGLLRVTYHAGYLAIGTTLYQGQYRIYDYPSGVVIALPTTPSYTYNYDLGQIGLPYYLLDLRTAPPTGAVANWLSGSTSATTLLMYDLSGEDASSTAPLGQWFDVILHVQVSAPSQHF